MITEECDLRFRNARLRSKIVELVARAEGANRLLVRSITQWQATIATDNATESLKQIRENIRMRVAELVRAGVASPEDFQGL
jgi:hypothetical protein